MKKEGTSPHKFESLSDAHRAFGLPKPKHPLISLIGSANVPGEVNLPSGSHVLNFYKISYKTSFSGGKLKYGQHYYDFDEGGLLFASPGQIVGNTGDGSNNVDECSLYTLLVHPDFLWNHPLSKNIKQYGFFSYSANEALHLSEDEKEVVISIFRMVEAELNGRIDDFSQNVVISQIELLLNYADRFYKRQFITRKAVNSDLLQKLDELLESYFVSETPLTLGKGLPTVGYLAEHLNLTPTYLSDMLRSLTGQNAKQHIQCKLTEKAKEILSTTSLSASEVAYQLGFEHPQSFTKFFKNMTHLSPLEFRVSFN
ncbi:MAG: helix-turn-helix domain-containing protein [Janthinobacterium lividum]